VRRAGVNFWLGQGSHECLSRIHAVEFFNAKTPRRKDVKNCRTGMPPQPATEWCLGFSELNLKFQPLRLCIFAPLRLNPTASFRFKMPKGASASTENVAKVLLPLLSNRAQTDFRNRLVIVSADRARWIRTTEP
jgi:hypothetical protein